MGAVRCRPITPSEVTDLPEPDSPTMPRVCPGFSIEADAVDRLDQAVVGLEVDAQIPYGEEGLVVAGTPAGHRLARRLGLGNLTHESLTLGSMAAYTRSTSRLQMTMKKAATSVTPMTIGRSLSCTLLTAYWPSAGEGEHGLGDHGAAEQQTEVHAEDGDDRGQRGPQPVLADDPALLAGPWRGPYGCSPRPWSPAFRPG